MAQHRIAGMDPYIEAQAWRDFHANFIVSLQGALMPLLAPKYFARIEEQIYIDEDPDGSVSRYPDVSIETAHPEAPRDCSTVALAPQPTMLTIPMPIERRERYIEIYTRSDRQLVTVIELLSPTNKRTNSIGRREYLDKRRQLLQARVNLVEIDLTLQGERMPTNEPLPEGDYYVLIARGYRLPVVEVYAWKVGQPLPSIPIPLLREDPDVFLNLQDVYEQVYARARYDLQLDFTKPLPTDAPAR